MQSARNYRASTTTIRKFTITNYRQGLTEGGNSLNAAVGGDSSGFVWASVAFAGLVVFQIALRAVNRFFEELSRSGMENRFKGRLFSTLLSKDYASVTKVNSGEWVNRLTSDTVVVADGLAQILPGVAGMAVKMAGAMAAILYLEPKFIFILVPGGLLLIFFTFFSLVAT